MPTQLSPVIERLALKGHNVPLYEASYLFSSSRRPLNRSELNQVLAPWLQGGLGRIDSYQLSWDQAALHKVMLQLSPHTIRQAYPTNCYSAEGAENHLRLASYVNDVHVFKRFGAGQFSQFLLPALHLDWFLSRDPYIQMRMLVDIAPRLYHAGLMEKSMQKVIDSLALEQAGYLQVELGLLRGDWIRVEQLLSQYPDLKKAGYEATMLFLQGKTGLAHQAFLKAMGKRKSNHPAFLGMAGLFGLLAAIHNNDFTAMANSRYHAPEHAHDSEVLRCLAQKLQLGHSEELRMVTEMATMDLGSGLNWCLLWSLRDSLGLQLQPRPEVHSLLEGQGLHILAEQLKDTPSFSWAQGLGGRQPWQVWLEGLRQSAQHSDVPKASAGKGSRLIWNIEGRQQVAAHRQALKETTFGGASVSLSSLSAKPPDYLSEQDRVILGKLGRQRLGNSLYLFFEAKTLQAMVGHPHLYYRGKSCQLREIQQSLHLTQTPRGYQITLEPALQEDCDFVVLPLEEGVAGLYVKSPHHSRLAPLLCNEQLIPLSAEAELREALSPWLEKINLTYAKNTRPLAETLNQSSPLLCLLQPERQGLKLSWGIQPLGSQGPTLAALSGSGAESLHWQGKLYQIQRHLNEEKSQLKVYCQHCPALGDGQPRLIVDREEALDLLEELRQAKVPMHWPLGKSWKLSAPVGTRQVSLKAQADGDWFALQGQVQIHEDLVVELGRMLELLRQHPGRYVPISEDQFAHITEEVRQQLNALDELVETQRKGLRLSPLAVPTLAELEFSQMEVDQVFQATLERFAAASNYRAQIPKALEAELRDYQIEGFRWLAQRARAGCGACLADDMGLGKTLQALTLMVKEQRGGPHLVICPTSVTSNWKEQIDRFTPSLQAVLYEGKGREELLAQLQAGQVVICSYRMLLQDQERVCALSWNLALLDEAQYIKNPEAKTSRACFTLKASIRVTTSGTPIENRLSELWSIFRYLNPGLLGTLASFRKRFEQPISEGNGNSRRRLRRLIAPFLLRRTKSQVLSELPSRTEVTLEIELSAPERAIYEKLRRQAEESLGDESGRFELLAHLTRLRQACCHPSLLAPELKLTSSKLDAFLELLDELRQGHHRALVFSQFTRLLDLLEAELKERQVEFFRLDGSTPVAERRRQVEAFQGGQGDLFLISLKAGGTGLNLTGADYVVHLDPWWNPASEDQASDRTHRIGQTRPVTIYRLIAKHTIEEKVVQMHGHKRHLAETILSGGEATTLSQQELLDLLRDD